VPQMSPVSPLGHSTRCPHRRGDELCFGCWQWGPRGSPRGWGLPRAGRGGKGGGGAVLEVTPGMFSDGGRSRGTPCSGVRVSGRGRGQKGTGGARGWGERWEKSSNAPGCSPKKPPEGTGGGGRWQDGDGGPRGPRCRCSRRCLQASHCLSAGKIPGIPRSAHPKWLPTTPQSSRRAAHRAGGRCSRQPT